MKMLGKSLIIIMNLKKMMKKKMKYNNKNKINNK